MINPRMVQNVEMYESDERRKYQTRTEKAIIQLNSLSHSDIPPPVSPDPTQSSKK